MQCLEAYLVSDSKQTDPVAQAADRDPAERRLLFLCSILSAEFELKLQADGTCLLAGTIREIPVGQPIEGVRITMDPAGEEGVSDNYGRFVFPSLTATDRCRIRLGNRPVEVTCALPDFTVGAESPFSS